MKYTIIAAIMMFTSTAFSAPTSFTEKVTCTVATTSGQLNSFLPPVDGDTVTIDASQDSIQQIQFDSGNMMPILVPLQRDQNGSVPSYLATFTAVQDESSIEKLSLVLMVGKFFDGTKDVYSGKIQNVDLDKADGMTSLGEVTLNCQPAK